MNRIERIEADLPNRTPDRHSVWFVTLREDDVRALLRLAKAVQAAHFVGDVDLSHEEKCALAALEAPCDDS